MTGTRSRRGKGEGSIFQRKDGVWCAAITATYDASGKRVIRREYGATKREVMDKLRVLQAARATGTLIDPSRLTVGRFFDHWLDVTRQSVRATTYAQYESLLRVHAKPHLGGVLLSKLQPLHVQGLYSRMEGLGVPSPTRRLLHAVLHRAFVQGVKWGNMLRNPCDLVDRPRETPKRMGVMTEEQAGRFLAAAKEDRLYALYILALSTGMRQGELLGLRWEDVDLAAATLSVRHTLEELKGKLELTETKTGKSRRVDLDKRSVAALKVHQAAMLAEGHRAAKWVFCDTSGGALRKSNLRRRSFHHALIRAGIVDRYDYRCSNSGCGHAASHVDRQPTECPKCGQEMTEDAVTSIRFHDLRHTAATLMLQLGIHPKVVQERLGHSRIAVTLDTYSHVLPSMQVDAATKLSTLMATLGVA